MSVAVHVFAQLFVVLLEVVAELREIARVNSRCTRMHAHRCRVTVKEDACKKLTLCAVTGGSRVLVLALFDGGISPAVVSPSSSPSAGVSCDCSEKGRFMEMS